MEDIPYRGRTEACLIGKELELSDLWLHFQRVTFRHLHIHNELSDIFDPTTSRIQVNRLKPSDNCMSHLIQQPNNLRPIFLCVFRMILKINSGCFLKQRQPVDLRNGEVWYFLCGTDWIIKYHIDELRLRRAKYFRLSRSQTYVRITSACRVWCIVRVNTLIWKSSRNSLSTDNI
jgi:hypothetical protein